jgi:hypothetical protein
LNLREKKKIISNKKVQCALQISQHYSQNTKFPSIW